MQRAGVERKPSSHPVRAVRCVIHLLAFHFRDEELSFVRAQESHQLSARTFCLKRCDAGLKALNDWGHYNHRHDASGPHEHPGFVAFVFLKPGDYAAGGIRIFFHHFALHSAPRRAVPTGTTASTSARAAPARTAASAATLARSPSLIRRGLRLVAQT